ncbi:extracellular solute-binding protein [Paenibacillus cymbidii]|uniref:extracellular solute-binding protein n=1 Tax=Paenibacillus cymbidii TaxID=1639034 RepID=UPI00108042B3|nr:extracellular solute-binding protein [Paenibacillus cymbidii]
MKKSVGTLSLALLLVGSLLAGCTSKNNGNSAASPSTSTGTAASTAPSGSANSSSPKPAADNMAEKVKLHIMVNGWINNPANGEDPIKKYLNDKFNVDIQFDNINANDLENKLLVQFSSNQPPDIIFASDKNKIVKLHNQGVLLDDLKPYLDKVPSIKANFNDLSIPYGTVGGKLIGLPVAPRTNNWGMMIRQDWLDSLGMKQPTNEKELLDVLRAFTFKDPDKNGKDDTWGISAAGAGKGVGEISFLAAMFGPTGPATSGGDSVGYYMDGGKLTNTIMDGNHQKFLDLLRTIVSEKLIDPDWYTQGWEQRKAKLFGDKYGIAWYPPADLYGEADVFANSGKDPTTQWLPMTLPKAGSAGGLRPPGSVSSGMYAITAEAAKNPVKLQRILKLLNDVTYPNEAYFALRWGVGVPGIGNKLVDMGGGLTYFDTVPDTVRTKNTGLIDWGSWVAVGDKVFYGAGPLTDATKKRIGLDNGVAASPAYPNFQDLVTFDSALKTATDQLKAEFEIKYVLDKGADYASFKADWLKKGGEKMLTQASEQLKAMGIAK